MNKRKSASNLHKTSNDNDPTSNEQREFSSSPLEPTSQACKCPQCNSQKLFKDGKRHTNGGTTIQLWLARALDPRAKPRPRAYNSCQDFLEKELRRLQRRTRIGYELKVDWLPGRLEQHDGRKLAEEVQGDTIIIYADNPKKAIELLRHGFLEWLMNRHTKPYRQLINKLIEIFEDLAYENKEKTIEALERLL